MSPAKLKESNPIINMPNKQSPSKPKESNPIIKETPNKQNSNLNKKSEDSGKTNKSKEVDWSSEKIMNKT